MVTSLQVVAYFLNSCCNKRYVLQFWPNCGLLLQILRVWWSYKLLDTLKIKARFKTIPPYFSLNITLRSLYCNFKCSHILCSSIMIQNNTNSVVYHLIIVRYSMKTIHWYFPRRPPCIYAIWPAEVKSYNTCTAITHFLTPATWT